MSNSRPSTFVSVEQYTSALDRLESEVQESSRLQADLLAARERVTFLERQLAQLSSATHQLTRTSSEPECFPGHAASAAESERKGLVGTASTESTPHHTPSSYDARSSSPTSADGDRASPTSQDKEILSHCSDISGSKGATAAGVRSPCAQPATSRPLGRKQHAAPPPSTPSVAPAVRKQRSKKERPQKVKIPGQSRYWTPDEHKLFLEALNKYGHKDLRSISLYVGTRNMTQVRTHSQKYFMRLMREAKRQNPASRPTDMHSGEPSSDDKDSKQEGTVSSSAPSTVVDVGNSEARVASKDAGDDGDKYSVPNTCGMTLLCLVGQDTLPV